MNALFLADLAHKTRRGLRGRVEAGRSGGGLTYGYKVVQSVRGDGTLDLGSVASTRRKRRSSDASSKRRRRPPRAHRPRLNAEGVAAPRRGWGVTITNKGADLNNRLYVGKLVGTSSATSRIRRRAGGAPSRTADAVIEKDVPELRIVEDASGTGSSARPRSARAAGSADATLGRRRPRYCLGPRQVRGAAAAMFRSARPTSAVPRRATRGPATAALGSAARAWRNDPERSQAPPDGARPLQGVLREFVREVNRLRQEGGPPRRVRRRTRARRRRISRIVEAVADGVPARSLKDELLALGAKTS